jgi:IS1 family transposase
MNKLNTKERARILACLVEGNSIRATVRMTGYAKNTIVKLLAEVGAACAESHDRLVRNLTCKRVQADEIWSFIYSKQANVRKAKAAPFDAGDAWTWTGMCADSKLMIAYAVGDRTAGMAHAFVFDVASRLKNRIQLTTDGNRLYVHAVEGAFGGDVDYAVLEKVYGKHSIEGQRRYSPPECIGVKVIPQWGEPDPAHISTSFVERQNLTMRMSMRRFTRLTNGFSKKMENHYYAVALHFMYYNFCRIHQTLRVTPAMEAGISDHVWSLEEIAALTETKVE